VAFGLVDDQFQLPRQEPGDAAQHPFSRALALHQNDEIIDGNQS
jgi:hypothetical protein